MKYSIITDISLVKLESKVQTLLNEDWVPQGGICVDATGFGSGIYAQALISK
jgi:hypothetical protein